MERPAVLEAARLRSEARLSGEQSQCFRHRARRERRRSERRRARSLGLLAELFTQRTLDQVAPLSPLDDLGDVFVGLEDTADCLELHGSERPLLTLLPRPTDD
jgi:hypothetical protein